MSQRFVHDPRHVPVRPFPWRSVVLSFVLVSAFAAIDGNVGWRSTFASASFASWVAALIACVRVRPRPIAAVRDGGLVLGPRRARVYGFAALLVGPLSILSAVGGAWPISVACVLFGAFIATLARRRIRLVEGGFEQIGPLGRVVRGSWGDVRAIELDDRSEQLRLFVGESRSHYVMFPEAWDGVATFAAAAASGIPEDVRQRAPEAFAVIERFAALALPREPTARTGAG
jgi:hypothetical protein